MRLLILVALSTMAVAAPAGAKCGKSASNPLAELDLATWEAATPAAKVDAEVLAKAISKRDPAAVSLDHAFAWRDQAVAIHSRCGPNACGGGVALIKVKGAKARVVSRALLPFGETPWRMDGEGFSVGGAGIADVDHDGADELVVRYELTGKPERAVGSQSWEYLAIFNLPALSLAWVERVGQGGQASVHEGCEWTLTWRDDNCDRRTDISLARRCAEEQHCLDEANAGEADCKGYARPKAKTDVWLHDKKLDAYVPKGGKPPFTPIGDGLPFLVIAASFPEQGPDAAGDAKARAIALKAKGLPDVTFHDSRAFSRLACCYQTVVVGRFATKPEADARVAELQAKGVKANVRKGFLGGAPLPNAATVDTPPAWRYRSPHVPVRA
jgi:hypothetical protein